MTWKEGHRDPDFHMLLDAEGDVVAGVMRVGGKDGWCATDADGKVMGYAKTLAAAKELIERALQR